MWAPYSFLKIAFLFFFMNLPKDMAYSSEDLIEKNEKIVLQKTTLQNIPLDVFGYLLTFVPNKDLERQITVNKFFLEAIYERLKFPNSPFLSFSLYDQNSLRQEIIERAPAVHIVLEKDISSLDLLNFIDRFPCLSRLSLKGDITQEHLNNISGIPDKRKVTFSIVGLDFNEKSLNITQKETLLAVAQAGLLKKIERLNLKNTHISEEMLQKILKVTDSDLMPNLSFLSIAGNRGSEEIFELFFKIMRKGKIRNLDLSGLTLSKKNQGSLQELYILEKLSLLKEICLDYSCQKQTVNYLIKKIIKRKIPPLEKLNLAGISIHPKMKKRLIGDLTTSLVQGNLSHLSLLNLSNIPLLKDHIKNLSKWISEGKAQNMVHLNLAFTRLKDEDIWSLFGVIRKNNLLPYLKSLDLRGNNLSKSLKKGLKKYVLEKYGKDFKLAV
jgi:hypothetical protein